MISMYLLKNILTIISLYDTIQLEEIYRVKWEGGEANAEDNVRKSYDVL